MHRRNFIKALSAFVAVAAAAPKSLAIRPVDWKEWNDFRLHCRDGRISKLEINKEDFTNSREARQELAAVLRIEGGSVFIGGDNAGVNLHLSEKLPDSFTVGFSLKLQTRGQFHVDDIIVMSRAKKR